MSEADKVETLSPEVPDTDDPVPLMWSGGFDSTALLLDLIRRGRKIRPYSMYNNVGKQVAEMEVRYKILAALKRRERSLVLPVYTMNLEVMTQEYPELWAAVLGWEQAMGIFGSQMSALRLCVTSPSHSPGGGVSTKPQLAIVKYDSVWWGIRKKVPGIEEFLKPFDLPYLEKTKAELWLAAPKRHKKILRMTWWCEGEWEAVEQLRTCVNEGVSTDLHCGPCKRRLECLEL